MVHRRLIGLLAALCGLALAAQPARAQTAPFDDAEAQLKVRQAVNAVTAVTKEIEELRTGLDAERKRTVTSDPERDINRSMIDTLQRRLKEAEDRLKERETALAAAQDARRRGLAAQPQAPSVEDEERRRRAQLDAEAGELQIGMSALDRQHVQVALTALGFNTGGSDGALGPRSREAIAGWQKARSLPPTGFLARPQLQSLLGEAQPAVAKFDADLKKQEDDRRLAEEEARRKAAVEAKAAAAVAPPPAAPPAAAPAPAAPPAATRPPAAAPPSATASAAPPASTGAKGWTGVASCDPWRGAIGTRLRADETSGRWDGKFGSYVTVTVQGNQVSGMIASPNGPQRDYYMEGRFSGTAVDGAFSTRVTASIAIKPAVNGPKSVGCDISLRAGG